MVFLAILDNVFDGLLQALLLVPHVPPSYIRVHLACYEAAIPIPIDSCRSSKGFQRWGRVRTGLCGATHHKTTRVLRASPLKGPSVLPTFQHLVETDLLMQYI